MTALSFNCEQMGQRFEAAVDGELSRQEALAYRSHIAICDNCRKEHTRAERIVCELPWVLTQTQEVEARTLNATRSVLNQIGADRSAVGLASKKARKQRILFLLAGWVGAIAILWRAVVVVGSHSQTAVQTLVTSKSVAEVASMLSMTPTYFIFFIFGVALLTAAAAVAVSRVWAED
ncbi:MAG: zf-HC2 domain-containing protein [Myxococcota bacterium]|nr:zf-HC2 domain-containing protein [Myxococcota bacterium]